MTALMDRAKKLETWADQMMAYVDRHWFTSTDTSGLSKLREEAKLAYAEAEQLMLEARP